MNLVKILLFIPCIIISLGSFAMQTSKQDIRNYIINGNYEDFKNLLENNKIDKNFVFYDGETPFTVLAKNWRNPGDNQSIMLAAMLKHNLKNKNSKNETFLSIINHKDFPSLLPLYICISCFNKTNLCKEDQEIIKKNPDVLLKIKNTRYKEIKSSKELHELIQIARFLIDNNVNKKYILDNLAIIEKTAPKKNYNLIKRYAILAPLIATIGTTVILTVDKVSLSVVSSMIFGFSSILFSGSILFFPELKNGVKNKIHKISRDFDLKTNLASHAIIRYIGKKDFHSRALEATKTKKFTDIVILTKK